MTVKEHYDNLLGNFYSWMAGDFDEYKNNFKNLCLENNIQPAGTGFAIDLGAGHGIQTLALAELGFKVTAIDFNAQLLAELSKKIIGNKIKIINGDIRQFLKYVSDSPELIICCGDTLAHLETVAEVNRLIKDSFKSLEPKGKLIFTFRDYSSIPTDTKRFIPVKSDDKRIFTCFLEYFDEKIRVTDLLYELENDHWELKAGSYFKLRITEDIIKGMMLKEGFELLYHREDKGMMTMIGRKS